MTRLHVILGSWNRETSGLFNIHATEDEVSIRHIFLTEPRFFLCQPSYGKALINSRFVSNNFTQGLKIFKINFAREEDPENYIQSVNDKLLFSQGIWELLEEKQTDSGTQLKVNDIIRIGRQILKISKVVLLDERPVTEFGTTTSRIVSSRITNPIANSNFNQHQTRTYQNSVNNGQDVHDFIIDLSNLNDQGSNLLMCRICLEPETRAQPFEKDLCACSNRMPAHVSCLISWLNRKCESTKYKNMTYFDLSQLFCDICHTRYPSMIKVNGNDHFIVDVKAPDNKAYITIDVYELSRDVVKGILLIEFDDRNPKKITLGRHESCDIVFKDISVSRNHAYFMWKGGKFYVADEKSKFGTLRKVIGRFSLEKCVNKRFVIDKFIFCFHVLKSKNLCSCFKKKLSFVTNPNDMDNRILEEDPATPVITSSALVPPPSQNQVPQSTQQPNPSPQNLDSSNVPNRTINMPNNNEGNPQDHISQLNPPSARNLSYFVAPPPNFRPTNQMQATQNARELMQRQALSNARESIQRQTVNQNQSRANGSLLITDPMDAMQINLQRLKTQAECPEIEDLLVQEMKEESILHHRPDNRIHRSFSPDNLINESSKFGVPDPHRHLSSRRILEVLNADHEIIEEELIINENDLDEWRSEQMSVLDQFKLANPVNVS